jgi:hypothetical protein
MIESTEPFHTFNQTLAGIVSEWLVEQRWDILTVHIDEIVFTLNQLARLATTQVRDQTSRGNRLARIYSDHILLQNNIIIHASNPEFFNRLDKELCKIAFRSHEWHQTNI